MKRIGLMGYGVVASYGHAPAIRETPGLQLVSVFDPSESALRSAGEQHPGVQLFSDSEAFFQSGLDAVAITSPAPVHLDNVKDAARHGLPVLCEKPLAMNDEDIETMIAIMESAGLPLASAFCYRFSPVALQIKEMVAQRTVGDVRSLRLIYNWHCHGKYERLEDGTVVESSRRLGRMLEGGPMVDCGVHQIDLARFWMGEVVRQTGHGAWVDEYEAPDHMYLHLDHENGAHTMVEMSFSYCHTAAEPINLFSYELIGTGGVIRYNRDGWVFEARGTQGTHYLSGASEKNFAGMYHAWAHALETGERGALPTGRDGLIATRIAHTATHEVIASRPAFSFDKVHTKR